MRGTLNHIAIATGCVLFVGLIPFGGWATTASAATPRSSQELSLTVGIPLDSPEWLDLYYAEYEGFFKAEHLDLTVDNDGALVATDVDSGQSVLGLYGSTGSMTAVENGMPITNVYSISSGDAVASVVVPSSSTATSIMSLSGDRVVVQGVANAAYGAASTYSQYIVSKGGQPLTIVSVTSGSAISATLASGGAQAAIGLEDTVGSGIASGQFKVLVSASDPLATQLLGTDINPSTWQGTIAAIKAHKTAVERFLAGLALADKKIPTAPITTLVSAMQATPTYSSESAADIEASIGYDRPFWTKTDGFVTPTSWADSLEQFNTWGLSVNVANPIFDFKNFINMSYLTAATSTPTVPKSVKLTPGQDKLKVQWKSASSVAAITSYTVTASPGPSKCTTSAAATSCTLTHLLSGKAYKITVRAVNGFGTSKAASVTGVAKAA
jgi:ABC-type nitrate/sulfonate/bicarbonate transport system substrate-binding protein